MRIVFRVDAGTVPEIGTGHMVRSISVARALCGKLAGPDPEILFATRGGEAFATGRGMAAAAGIECRVDAGLEPNSRSELEILTSTRPDVVVMDRLATSAELVLGLQEAGSAVWTFDDLGEGRRRADIAINALLQDVEPAPNVYVGYDYLVLPPRRVSSRQPPEVASRIFACFGGFDARGLSELVLDALRDLQEPFECDLVVGDTSSATLRKYREKADEMEEAGGHVVRLHGRADLTPLLETSDVAVVSGGMMAFETARSGVPAIGVPQYEHQLENLDRLDRAGCLRRAGRGMTVAAADIATVLNALTADPRSRSRMGRAGRQLIDGEGLDRVTNIFVRALDAPGARS